MLVQGNEAIVGSTWEENSLALTGPWAWLTLGLLLLSCLKTSHYWDVGRVSSMNTCNQRPSNMAIANLLQLLDFFIL